MEIDYLLSVVKVFDETQFSNIRELGSGGESMVISGTYGEYGTVALKCYYLKADTSARREVYHLLKHSFHPNIIRILGIMERIDAPTTRITGIVMEFMENGSLHEVIYNQSLRYNMEDAFNWMIQAARALCYLHSSKIAHRDIKPKNLLLCNNYRQLKLGDFGITRRISESTNLTGEMGTWLYMPPEVLSKQAIGKYRYTTNIDIYSFAITFWEVLTKTSWDKHEEYRPPIKEVIAFLEKYMANNTLEFKSLSEMNDDIKSTIQGFVEAAVSTGSLVHLAEDVQRILHAGSLCGKSPVQDEKITASNIMDWRAEQAKKGILNGPQLEQIFLIECETLMLQMTESVKQLQPVDKREPNVEEVVLQILEELALRYEPTVEKLKKRYSEESSTYSMEKRKLFTFKILLLEEQLKEFRNVFAERSVGFSKKLSDAATGMNWYIFEDKRCSYRRGEMGNMTCFLQSKLGENLLRSFEYTAKFLEEVIEIINQNNDIDTTQKAIIENYKTVGLCSQLFREAWEWYRNVDAFIKSLQSELIVKDEDILLQLETGQDADIWPKRKAELSQRFEELSKFATNPENTCVRPTQSPTPWQKVFHSRRACQLSEAFIAFVKRGDLAYRVLNVHRNAICSE